MYSSLRDPGQTQAFRNAARSESSAWHGDTFKVVFAIHDFHLGLDYRTIVGSWNPQTLVWRSNTKQRQPQLDSLEAISRMTYFDTVNQALMLRQSPEEITITECLKALTS